MLNLYIDDKQSKNEEILKTLCVNKVKIHCFVWSSFNAIQL